VQRYADSNNLILLAVLLEIKQVVALIAINNKELISAYNSPLCMLIKVAILRDCNNLVLGQILLLILGREVIAALKDNKG
jgi:hypothetical protein